MRSVYIARLTFVRVLMICTSLFFAAGELALGAPVGRGVTYYVDCSTRSDPNTHGKPPILSSLAAINAVLLKPGDTVLFKAGSTCVGTFTPQGEGSAEAPVRVGAYGASQSIRPKIDGAGAIDTVLVRNFPGIELRDLEITNSALPSSKRRGIRVVLENYGIAHHVVLQNLYIHDISGDDTKDIDGSGGILVNVVGYQKPSSFDDLRILDNTVDTVDRSGIAAVASVWQQRIAAGNAKITYPWSPSTNVVIKNNLLKNIGGDGIVVSTALGALVEGNTVTGFQMRSAGYNAGLWPWNSDGSIFRFNEASGGHNTRDGMAFDVDQGTDGTVFEHNFSHDNAGGFLLLCNATGTIKNAVIRYNVSQNDRFRGIENCRGEIESADIYNNTIYIGPGISQTVINENNDKFRKVLFRNNIVFNEGPGTAGFHLAADSKYFLSSNFLFGVNLAPPNSGRLGIDPQFIERGAAKSLRSLDGYRLRCDSAALRAGTVIKNNGGQDIFGNPVSATSTPNVGVDNGNGIAEQSSPCRYSSASSHGKLFD